MGLWQKAKGFFGRIGRGIAKGAKAVYNVGKGIVGKVGTVAGAAIGSAFGAPQVGAQIGGIAQNVANALPNAKL